jgi:EAL domain-containing protein (putative c-di-GMP-specific phosphodiesterase class I)
MGRARSGGNAKPDFATHFNAFGLPNAPASAVSFPSPFANPSHETSPPRIPIVSDRGQPDSELETIGRRMLSGLSALRLGSLSLHDERGDVLWLNESVMGPDEHEAVRAALEAFAGEGTPPRYEHDLGDGRLALALRASYRGTVLGLALLIIDAKSLAGRVARERTESMLRTLEAPLEELAAWLGLDMSATQTRIRTLTTPLLGQAPAEAEAEAEAQAEAAVAAEVAAQVPAEVRPEVELPQTPAVPERRAAGSAAPAAVGPALDRHFAALRALPLVLYAQRLEPMKAGSRIRRFEILLRTGSEHGRTQAPVAMLDAAVKRGLGSVIDRRVITEVITWLKRNPMAWRTDPLLFSINLSPSALADDHFLKFLELCLAKAELPRGMLAFELDATLCAQHLARSARLSEMLAAFGCTFIIDDFTLRDPLLELLSMKGLRMLKLHAALTSNISADKHHQAIAAGIAQMARVLSMHTCAKHIESRTDQRWLAALKIDFAQGFAFSEPLPLTTLAARP